MTRTSREIIRDYLVANRDAHSLEAMVGELAKAGHAESLIRDVSDELDRELEDEYVRSRMAIVESTLAGGRDAYIYRSLYFPVDSVMNEETLGQVSDSMLALLGLGGWEVVASIPRTIGAGLTNYSLGSTMGRTWGGGMGGNVLGSYLILRYTITRESLETSRASVEAMLRERMPG